MKLHKMATGCEVTQNWNSRRTS